MPTVSVNNFKNRSASTKRHWLLLAKSKEKDPFNILVYLLRLGLFKIKKEIITVPSTPTNKHWLSPRNSKEKYHLNQLMHFLMLG